MAELKAEDRSLWEKFRDFIREFAAKIRQVYEKLRPDSAEGKIVAQMKEAIEELQNLFVEGLVDASENFAGAQKNTAGGGGVNGAKYSVREGMTDAERYAELKNEKIVVHSDGKSSIYSEEIENLSALSDRAKSKAEKIIIPLAKKLGILGRAMTVKDVDVDFIFSKNNGLTESISKQLRYGGNYVDFAKTLMNLDEVINSAVLIEVHGDKYAGTVRANENLQAVYVLFGAFRDGNNIIPVQMEIKKSSDAGGRLYLTVALTKIEADVLGSTPDKSQTHSLISASEYSLTDLFGKINPKDKHFLKYLPDGFLNEEQLKAKMAAMQEDEARIAGYEKKFSQRDSDGNQLSEGQQEYFKNSQVRDDKGRLLVLYHQTDGEFTIFDTRHPGAGSRDGDTPFGIFLKRSAGDIGLSGKKQMTLYANIKNPLRATNREDLVRQLREISERYASICDQHKKLDAEYREKFEQAKKAWVNYIAEWRSANPGASRTALNEDPKFNELYDAEDNVIDEWTAAADRLSIQAKEIITEDLRKSGYDGVFLAEDVGSWGRKTDAIIALDPEQVKNITNKKPTQNSDIRYSDRDPDYQKVSKALEQENQKLKEDVSYLKELVSLQRQVTGGTKFTRTSVEAVAKAVRRNAGARGDIKELAGLLNGLYEFIASEQELTWEAVTERAQPAVDWLMEHTPKRQQRTELAQDVLNQIRGSRVHLDEEQMQNVAYRFGSYNDFRKGLFGNITLSKDADTSLDTLWQQLSEQYPAVFDPDLTASDQPGALADIIDRLRNDFEAAPEYGYDQEMREQELLRQVYDSYWNVSTLHTVADVKQKQINRLKGEHIQRIEKLRQQHREKVTALRQEHKDRVKALRQDLNRKAEEKQRKIVERYQESREKGIESREKTALRHKIKTFKSKLEHTLLHPSDSRYIPINLIKAMIEVCGLVDTDTELYRADGSINKAQERRNRTKEKLLDLEDAYKELKGQTDSIYAGEFDEMVYAYLTELRTKYTGKNLNEMSLDELSEMYEILWAIEETLQDARKLIGWGDAENIFEAGDAIIAEQSEIQQSRKNGKRSAVQKATDYSLNNSLSPMRNVERMAGYNENSYLLKLFKRFQKGIPKKNKFVMDAYKSFEELTAGKEYDDAVHKPVEGISLTDIKGRKFAVSKMQMMQAVLSFERERANNMGHIEKGGLTFADFGMLKKGKLGESISAEYAHRIPNASYVVAEFTEVLKKDAWCQKYMAAARQFFNGMAKDAINETGIALKHRIIAKDKNYIPFEVDKNFVNREISAENSIQETINSYGMLKETTNKAPQPLIITGLNNVLDRHIDLVGNVYGLAVEVRNFNKVWNMRSVSNNTTVKEIMETTWGKSGVGHIEQAVKDIQGPRIRERSAIYDKIKSGYINSTFLLNLSVVTKQIGSLFSATSMLRWRGPVRMGANLFYTMVNHKKISAEVDKYTATAWMRRQGLSDAELHTFLTEGKKTWVGKFVGKLPAALNPGKWIVAMDHTVALSLWKYAKIDTAKRTGLKGEELLKATAEFYDEVVENTQSMSDVLHRPEIQKRKDPISEAFAMFKTDLYQMAGQLEVTAGRFVANRSKENGAALGRTVYAIAASAVWGQLMTTLFALLRYKVNQYRDEDDEDLTAESWLKRQGFRLAGDLLGYIAPIFGSELVGIFENIKYGESGDVVDNIVLTAINDLTDIMITVGSALDDEKMPSLTDMRKIGAKAFQVFGFPVSNILRTLDATYLHAKDIANGKFFSFEAGVDRTSGNHIHRIIEAVDAGKVDVAAGLFEEAVEELALRKSKDGSCGEDELKAAKSDLVTALGDKYKDGKVSKETASEILSELCGKSLEEVKGRISFWDSKIANPDAEVSANWFTTYYEKIESSGIDLDTYVEYRSLKSGYTKKEDILPIIYGMKLTAKQKDALYLAEGWAASTLHEAPWY